MEEIRSGTISFKSRKYSYPRILFWMLNHPKVILGALVLITILLGLKIPDLPLRFSIYDSIIEKLPETRAYHRHLAVFGSEDVIRITFKTHNIYYPTVFNTIDQVAKALARISGVAEVISLPHIKRSLESSSPMNLDRFKEVVEPMEVFKNYLIARNGKETAVILVLKNGANPNDVIQQTLELLDKMKIGSAAYLTGMPFFNYFLGSLIYRDFFLIPLLIILISVITLFLLLRNVMSVVLIFSCVALAQIWTLGLMSLFNLPFSLLSFIALIFLWSVQTTYALNVVTSCMDAYNATITRREAVRIGYSRVPLPLILSITTTLFGLTSFLFNPIHAINEFAVFILIGMLIFLFLVFTFLPLVISVYPFSNKPDEIVKTLKNSWPHRLTNLLSVKQRRRWYVVPILITLTTICLIGFIRFNVATNPLEIFEVKKRSLKIEDDIHQNVSKNFPISITLKAPDKQYFFDPLNIKKIDHFQSFIESLPGIRQTLSFADHVKLANYALHSFKPQDYRLPETPLELKNLNNSLTSVLGNNASQKYISHDYSKANIIIFTQLANSNQLEQIRQAIENHAHKSAFLDFKINFTGISAAMSTSGAYLTFSQIKSMAITLIMVFGMLWFFLISLKVSLIAMLPILFPIIFTFGLTSWFGIKLNMFTSLTAVVAIGLTVGNVIHYIVHYHYEFKKDLDYHRSIQTTIEKIGTPIIYGTVCLGVGFSVLFISTFKPFSMFGLMMVSTMVAIFITNLILLPMLLHKFELVTMWDLFRLKLGKSPDVDSPLFNGLASHQIRSILMAGTLQKLAPREVLFNKGDMSDTMYAIVSGGIDIINFHRFEDAAGVHEIQKMVNQLYSGDVVGEMGFFRSTRRSATAIAIENTELLQINWSMIRRLQWLYPLTAQKFFINLMGIICDRLENVTNTLCDQSLIDDLTGLFNKKGFMQLLETETNRAQRYRDELAICLISLDLKGKISSTNTKTTEVMIRTVCQMLASEIRRTDVLSRIDVNLFAMVAPKTSKPQAHVLCQRLDQVLHRNLLGFGSPTLKVRLMVTNLIRGNKETAMDFLERSISRLHCARE
jgi:diguanylate cyclase (GGDEF)-like protein